VLTRVECRFLPSVGKAFAVRSMGQFETACKGFRQFLAKASPTAYPRESGRPPIHADRLAKGLSELRRAGVSAELCAKLGEFLSQSPAGDLVHFRPLEIAARLRVEPTGFLRACLLATRVGLTDLSWRVMCPYCRSNKDLSNSLSALASQVHCEACNIDYGAGFDQNVEVVFTVSKNLRPVDVRTYCIGGPQSATHAAAQIVLEPGESRSIEMTLEHRVWQIASLQAANRPRLVVTPGGGDRCFVKFGDGSCQASTDSVAEAFSLELANEGPAQVVLRIEEAEWRAKAITAAEVACLQTFRENFSSEVLAPGVEIGVSQVCILFTDLKGSTRMYREKGDAPSYAIVRKHFDRLQAVIDRHEGAVVKKIGDAVMACFHDPANAVRAALAIQSEEDPLITRIGLHWGPAIAVNANDLLDYFGRTVNLASRLQKHSQGQDVVLAAGLAEEVGVREAIASLGAQVYCFCADVPDVEEGMALVRLVPAKPIIVPDV